MRMLFQFKETVLRICRDAMRDHETVCVVEGVKDPMSLEKVREFHGLYQCFTALYPRVTGYAGYVRIDDLSTVSKPKTAS